MIKWIKSKLFPKPPQRDLKSLEGLEAFCNLYHRSVEKYGSDGHDQFVEVVERVYEED